MMTVALIVCIVGALIYVFGSLAHNPANSDGHEILLTCLSNIGKIAFGIGLLVYLLRP